MVNLDKDIQYIKGVGPSRATLLKKLGTYNLGDLITYFPREYEDRGKEKKINELIDGEEALISAFPVGRINEIRIRKNLILYKLIVRDETGTCNITWYNQAYLKSIFKDIPVTNFYSSEEYGKYVARDLNVNNIHVEKNIPICSTNIRKDPEYNRIYMNNSVFKDFKIYHSA